jgi:hypothetical protein
MVKKIDWLTGLALSFVLLSVTTYFIHFLIFDDSTFIFKYFVAQLGFLPISTLLVTVVLNRLMGKRDRNARMQKLNMVIGAFYMDVGTDLLKYLASIDLEARSFGQHLQLNTQWSKADFEQAKRKIRDINMDKNTIPCHLVEIEAFLTDKREHLLRLLENPNLLEHESFSQLLWAVFHLTEEMAGRKDLINLSKADYAHLRGDISRVYIHLVNQWIDYMENLHQNYPYLFSLAIRTNPFDPQATIEVKE